MCLIPLLGQAFEWFSNSPLMPFWMVLCSHSLFIKLCLLQEPLHHVSFSSFSSPAASYSSFPCGRLSSAASSKALAGFCVFSGSFDFRALQDHFPWCETAMRQGVRGCQKERPQWGWVRSQNHAVLLSPTFSYEISHAFGWTYLDYWESSAI